MCCAVRELYEKGRMILREAGIPDADLDSRILLEESCGITLQNLFAHPDKTVADDQAAQYLNFIDRRAHHEPTAMIIGKWDFCGLTFRVTKDTLIPEQDTECLVEEALRYYGSQESSYFKPAGDRSTNGSEAEMKDRNTAHYQHPLRILDLCTGTGCILLSLLHFLPQSSGIGTDLSETALQVAGQNAESLGLADRSMFLQGDLWEALNCENTDNVKSIMTNPPFNGEDNRQRLTRKQYLTNNLYQEQFDLIVSNPPYIPTNVIPTLQPEVKDGEPMLALNGGPDGLVFYRRILGEAGRHLKPSGIIILESGFDEAGQIRELMQNAGFQNIRITKDYGSKDRVVSGTWHRI